MSEFDAMTDDDLAVQLQKLADSPRALNPERRAQLLAATAHRLLDPDVAYVDLGGDFTWVPDPQTGKLRHPAAEGDDLHGVLIHGITLAEAGKVAESLSHIDVFGIR